MNIPVQIDQENALVTIVKAEYPDFVFGFEDKQYRMQIEDFSDGLMKFTIDNYKHSTYLSSPDNSRAFVTFNGFQYELKRSDILTEDITIESSDGGLDLDSNTLTSPMPGKVIKINSAKGKKISKGDVVVVIEAMKMENNIVAHKDAVIDKIYISVGQMIEAGVPLVTFK